MNHTFLLIRRGTQLAKPRYLHSSSIVRNHNYSHLKMTFFGKPNCGLCDSAKEILDDVLEENKEFNTLTRKLKYININKDQHWWKTYCFDIPVLHIEDDRNKESLVKIMHFFKEDEIIETLKKFKH